MAVPDEVALVVPDDPLVSHEPSNAPSQVVGLRRFVPPPLLLVLIALSVGDIVLGAILLDQYSEVYSQFVNIGTAFCYFVASSIILIFRRLRRPQGQATEECAATSAPWYMLLCIGLLNGSSNFLLAISQPHTAGLTQSLLSTGLGVPLVMLLSFVVLRCTPSRSAIMGALFIVAGTAVSSMRGSINNDSGGGGVTTLWYSLLLFTGGQVMLAVEKVVEDRVFGHHIRQDVMVMFWWTMGVQLCLYLPLLPSQTMSELGGLQLSEIPLVMWDGVRCTFGITSTQPAGRNLPECGLANVLLFVSYVVVDMSCYFCGLYVIQKRGASMMVIASSVALPLQQVVFCLPFLVTKKYAERFFISDAAALVLVCIGYYVYQFLSREGKSERTR